MSSLELPPGLTMHGQPIAVPWLPEGDAETVERLVQVVTLEHAGATWIGIFFDGLGGPKLDGPTAVAFGEAYASALKCIVDRERGE